MEWEKRNPEKARNKALRYEPERRARLRSEVLQAYGGRCACCGEPEPKFLGVDHINNDGAEHRRELNISAGSRFYKWLKANKFPKDNFQLLCHNCNFAKGMYGECPHVKARQVAA